MCPFSNWLARKPTLVKESFLIVASCVNGPCATMSMLEYAMILFLDFDGVLHPVKSDINHIFCHLPRLETFLNSEHFKNWRIVFSTSWREPHTLDQLLDFMPESLHHRILGSTVKDSHPGPLAMDPLLCYRSPRHAQVLHYMASSANPSEAWLALDDDAKLFDPGLPQLVLCNGATGLTDETLISLSQQYDMCYNSYSPQWNASP